MSFTGTAIGRLTQDPVLREIPGGKQVLNFRIACNKLWVKDAASFFDVECWTNVENHMKYLAKGSQVALPGAELDHQQWRTDDGGYGNRVVIKAQSITYLAKPKPAEPELPLAEDEVIEATAEEVSA